jgi:hypothetical protein
MAETRPIIDSLDSSDDEETTVTSSIKRKEPPIKQTEDESKKKKISGSSTWCRLYDLPFQGSLIEVLSEENRSVGTR